MPALLLALYHLNSAASGLLLWDEGDKDKSHAVWPVHD